MMFKPVKLKEKSNSYKPNSKIILKIDLKNKINLLKQMHSTTDQVHRFSNIIEKVSN